MNRLVVISGCSSGGKSTLLGELAARGHKVVEEPGRRVARDEMQSGGTALPWMDAPAFLRRLVATALADYEIAAGCDGWVFFDRSLIDAASALSFVTGEPVLARYGGSHRYHSRVFMAPPWVEIFATDAERRHDFAAACAEYGRLLEAYGALGYQLAELPRIGVAERADFILSQLRA